MSSPFPGMDPYLEGDLWQEFHQTLAGAIRAQLMPLLTPKYVALLGKRYVIDLSPTLKNGDTIPGRAIYPDVGIAHSSSSPAAEQHTQFSIAAPEVEIASLLPEEVPQVHIEIRDIAHRWLVTIIELLSPANKQGDGARDYEQRRIAVLQRPTHLLEIDLLRRGQRIRLATEPPPAPYYVYLSRASRRPYTQVWPLALRKPLPTIPVPLLPPDPDVPLDMQAAIGACFDLVGYQRLLDYTAPPPPPGLSSDDQAWLVGVLAPFREPEKPSTFLNTEEKKTNDE